MSASDMRAGDILKMLSISGIKTVNDVPLENVEIRCGYQKDTIDCCKTVDCTSNQQQEKKMYYNEDMECVNPTTELERKADYFETELSQARGEKVRGLYTQFKLDLQDEPLSPKEYVQWLKDGWFKFRGRNVNEDGSWREPDGYNPRYQITESFMWNNPNRDTSGFNAAEAKVGEAEKKAERLIQASATPAEMLKALEEFESISVN